MSVGVLFTQGLVTGDPHRTLNEILARAEAADRLGFDFALTTEHKCSDDYFGSLRADEDEIAEAVDGHPGLPGEDLVELAKTCQSGAIYVYGADGAEIEVF